MTDAHAVDLILKAFRGNPLADEWLDSVSQYVHLLEAKLETAEHDAGKLYDNLKWLRSISFDNGEVSGIIWPNDETRDGINKAIEEHEKRLPNKIKQDPRGPNEIYRGGPK